MRLPARPSRPQKKTKVKILPNDFRIPLPATLRLRAGATPGGTVLGPD